MCASCKTCTFQRLFTICLLERINSLFYLLPYLFFLFLSVTQVAAQHGTELELLHRELDAANEAAEILANTVDEHIAKTKAEVQRLDQKVSVRIMEDRKE